MSPGPSPKLAVPLDRALLGLVLVMLVAANLSIAVSQIALGLSLGALALRRWPGGLPARATGLGLPAAVLAAWAALMIPLSTDPGQSLVFYRRFYLFAALWTTATAAAGERRLAWLLGALLAGAAAIAVWGQARMLLRSGSLFSTRLGEMSNPMTSGCLLMLVLLVAAGVMMAGGQTWRRRLLIAAGILPVLVGLLQTVTRSAWLGLAAGVTAMLVLRPRLRRWGGALALVLLAAVLLAGDRLPAGIRDRFVLRERAEQQSVDRRVGMWEAGWRLVRAHPLTGVGDRDLKTVIPRYTDPGETLFHGHLHSNPVMLAAIWGLPGLAAASAFMGWQLVLLLRWWRRLRGMGAPPLSRGWVLGAVGAWCGFAVAGLFEWYFGDAESMLLYLAIMGTALGGAAAAEEAHV